MLQADTKLKNRSALLKIKKMPRKSKKPYRNLKIELWMNSQTKLIKKSTRLLKKRLKVALLRKKKNSCNTKQASSLAIKFFAPLRKKFVGLKQTLKQDFSLSNGRVVWKAKLANFEKLFFFLTLKPIVSVQAYKLFLLMELQLNAVLLRAQIVPFFFLVSDLCFYRLVFVNQKIVNDPHLVLSLYDSVQLPIFLYQIMRYRQNRFYFYPKFLQKFFKLFWGQFADYNTDKLWLLSNYFSSLITGEALVYNFPNLLIYLAPFRRFSKLYYRTQPVHLKKREAGLSYTYTVFKLQLFNYANFYK